MVLKKTEKSPKTDAKKTGPFKDRKGEDRDRPKTGNCRTGTSLVGRLGEALLVYFTIHGIIILLYNSTMYVF